MVDALLTSFLDELGVSPDQFVETVTKSQSRLSATVITCLKAAEDFLKFKTLMVERNIHLNEQVIKVHEEKKLAEDEDKRAPLPHIIEDEVEDEASNATVDASATTSESVPTPITTSSFEEPVKPSSTEVSVLPESDSDAPEASTLELRRALEMSMKTTLSSWAREAAAAQASLLSDDLGGDDEELLRLALAQSIKDETEEEKQLRIALEESMVVRTYRAHTYIHTHTYTYCYIHTTSSFYHFYTHFHLF